MAGQMRPTVRQLRTTLRLLQSDESDEEQQSNRQSLLIVQDLLRRALTLFQPLSPDRLDGLIGLRSDVSAALRTSAPGSSAAVENLLNRAMDALVELTQSTGDAEAPQRFAPARRQLRLELAGIRAMAMASGLPQRGSDRAEWSLALDDLGVLQSAVTDGDVHNPQQISFIELSAYNKETSNKTPSEKLDGVQMAHFGAFYAPSWRHNDWMWGRLDGSFRLIAMIVDPEFLLEVGESGIVAKRLASILAGTPERRDTFAAMVESKLNTLTAMNPGKERKTQATLVQLFIAEALWDQEQTAILRKELPELIDSIRLDQKAGFSSDRELTRFLKSWTDAGEDPSSEQLVEDLGTILQFGAERLGGQLTSKRFDLLATQAAAVGATVLDDGIKWAPARWILRPLSWPFRAAHFLTFRFRRSRTR